MEADRAGTGTFPLELPRTADGCQWRELQPNAAQTYRLRGTKAAKRVTFDYVVPNG